VGSLGTILDLRRAGADEWLSLPDPILVAAVQLDAYRDASRRRRPVPRLHRLWGDQDRRCICVLADPAPNRSARVLVHAGVPTPPPGCEVPTMPHAGCFANGTMATIPSPGGRPDRIYVRLGMFSVTQFRHRYALV